ncbi:MAG: tetratricopeptide repeat protein, partial [Thermodesulfobacteriota bacterium]
MLKNRIKNLPPLLLVLLVFLIYSNVIGAPFIFDDLRYIVDNAFLRDLSNFYSFGGTRYVVFLSFAVNYAIGGLSPAGYHLVNIAIHALNSVLVFFLIRALFHTPACSSGAGGAAGRAVPGFQVAFVTALVFAAHPMETEAVAYVSQRFASLVALFYLLAIYCYISSRLKFLDRKRGAGFALFAAAFISALIAQKAKETAFTLPAVILLVEFLFFQRAVFSLKNGGRLALPFLALLAVIPLALFHPLGTASQAGIAQTLRHFQLEELATLSRSDYLFTEFTVLVTYIRLLFFPVGQRGDYDYALYHSFFNAAVFFSFVFLAIIFIVAVYLVIRSARSKRVFGLMAGFGLLWFFIIISIESSIVPIKDVIFEHRVYLPSAGVFLSLTSLYFYLA